ncbi:hypothetical protein H9P43_007997 [Blastocladiella emersonii ATCC 22665]|nr:hypothetical protein H9P43_007997 [Blastocladiella emersonii ATCC 22665]
MDSNRAPTPVPTAGGAVLGLAALAGRRHDTVEECAGIDADCDALSQATKKHVADSVAKRVLDVYHGLDAAARDAANEDVAFDRVKQAEIIGTLRDIGVLVHGVFTDSTHASMTLDAIDKIGDLTGTRVSNIFHGTTSELSSATSASEPPSTTVTLNPSLTIPASEHSSTTVALTFSSTASALELSSGTPAPKFSSGTPALESSSTTFAPEFSSATPASEFLSLPAPPAAIPLPSSHILPDSPPSVSIALALYRAPLLDFAQSLAVEGERRKLNAEAKRSLASISRQTFEVSLALRTAVAAASTNHGLLGRNGQRRLVASLKMLAEKQLGIARHLREYSKSQEPIDALRFRTTAAIGDFFLQAMYGLDSSSPAAPGITSYSVPPSPTPTSSRVLSPLLPTLTHDDKRADAAALALAMLPPVSLAVQNLGCRYCIAVKKHDSDQHIAQGLHKPAMCNRLWKPQHLAEKFNMLLGPVTGLVSLLNKARRVTKNDDKLLAFAEKMVVLLNKYITAEPTRLSAHQITLAGLGELLLLDKESTTIRVRQLLQCVSEFQAHEVAV